MKTNMLRGWRWVLAVSGTVLLLGCLDRTNGTSATSAQAVAEPETTTIATTKVVQPEPDPLPTYAVIPPANLSPGIEEVVKLAQSGVSEDVLLAYVQKSSHAFNPSVDEIVYLKDIGVPDSVVTAMVRHAEASQIAQSSAKLTAALENNTAVQSVETNLTGPSLIDPNAPSYSVAAETNYGDAATVSPPTQPVNVSYFEDALSPYGSWVEVPDYGRCWQPTVVVINRNWRPYADRGRWIYTSSGWYWQSDYSWGWAPFHYGRWHCDSRIGWVWVPGSTWGPAWVSWRYTDQYCGWAPLPPSAHYVSGFGFRYRGSHVGISFDFGLSDDCYTFIPTGRFCERTPWHYYVSRSHSKSIYKTSHVINNYVRNHDSFVNEGVGRDRIALATRTPVRTVALRELPETSNPIGKAERLEGNSLTVFRPKISSANGRFAAQRSITTSAQPTPSSKTPTRSLRELSRPGITAATGTQNPTVANPATKTITRNLTPSSGVTHSSRPLVTAPKQSTFPVYSAQPVQRSIVTAQPSVKNFPAQNSSREIDRRFQRREVTVAETPRAVERNTAPIVPKTPVYEAPRVRTAPSVPQIQRPQPSVREIRRQNTPDFSRNVQRSVRPSSPVQNFTPPREISRGISRVERSAPPQVSQPRPSSPSPSVRQSAPRQESSSRRIERSVERSSRSERNRS